MDFGLPSDALFYGVSTATTPTGDSWVAKGDYTRMFELYFEGMGKRATDTWLQPSTFIGYQVFDSTRFPRPKFNTVKNWKSRAVQHPCGRAIEKYNNPNTLYVDRYKRQYWSDSRAEYSDPFTGKVASDINWGESQAASNRAWWTLQPRFEGDFQALNFLYELKDFKDIANAISALRPAKIVETLKRARSMINRAKREVAKGNVLQKYLATVSASTRVAAEALLVKRFAIDPTIMDLATLYNQLQSTVQDAQHRFRDKGQEMNRRHYSEEISRSDNRVIAVKGSNYYFAGWGWFQQDQFTATMEFDYMYNVRDKMAAMRKYYGLDLNAGVVWEAVPFSFLLDYFIGIQDAIDAMSQDPNVQTNLHQYCESRLKTFRSGMSYVEDGRTHAMIINGAPARPDQLIIGWEGSLYERRVCAPNKGLYLPRIKVPSVKQAQNIMALVRCLW
jgi:hypothetical protein